jgi:cytochrome c2
MNRRPVRRLGQALPLLVVLTLALLLGSCDGAPTADGPAHGDAATGERLFVEYGCAACHQISGVRQARGNVGPDLDGLAEQRIIAGVLPNTPGHLAAWLMDPRRYAPNTGMPDVGVTEEDAQDLVAFLLTRD